MGNWVNKDGWSIATHNLGDQYLHDVVAYMAMGGGRSAHIVLSCVDDVYAEARKRGLVRGVWGVLLKWHTKRLWKHKLYNKDIYAPGRVRIPFWVSRIIGKYVPYGGSCD